MKRLRRIIFTFTAVVCVLISAVIAVNAHSGKTDSDGGHTDHDTGEYHYHHGYPAHDHYDIDGDGDTDCPYEFDDRTNHNTDDKGSHTTHKENNGSGAQSSTAKSDKNINNAPDDAGSNDALVAVLSIVAIGLYLFFVLVFPLIY